MTRSFTFAALAAGTAMVALQSVPALAEGTSAGTVITNTATVDYRVGGIDQTEVVASDTFEVDRKINLIVTRISGPAVSVSPGQTGAVIAFDVTNLSNDTIDLALSAIQSSADNFDVDNVRIFRDDGNGSFDGADTLITSLDEVVEDASVRVFVVSDVSLSSTNGEDAELVLSATAHSGGSPGTLGAVLVSTPGPDDPQGVETVLADGAGEDDVDFDGVYNAPGSFTVFAASLNVAKTSRVIDDPVNGVTNPKAIPGATVEYCIAVSNGAGAATATNVEVTDVLPGDLTFVVGSIMINGTLDGSGNCTGGDPGGSIAVRTITAPLSDVAAGETRTAAFRATIN